MKAPTLALALALALALGACAPALVAHPGGEAYTIRCSYAGRPESACYVDADRVCPGGWTAVDVHRASAVGMVTLVVVCKGGRL